MVLKRFYDEVLAQASYLIGCPRCAEAVVIDPSRDIAQYIESAKAEKLRIAHVAETHIHADFASGSRELARQADAALYLSKEGGPEWQYSHPDAVKIGNGSQIRVGSLRLDVLHTPGHTPEHVCFVLTDESVSDTPICAFTGDLLFVGDVGRPDLLERAAGFAGTMQLGAETLYDTLQDLKNWPDGMVVWPGHGAGSTCGKSLGGAPCTSMGYERATNWALKCQSKAEFVENVLDGQPDPPKYFAEMKRLNKQGAEGGAASTPPAHLPANELPSCLGNPNTVVLDVRPTASVSKSFASGAIHIGMGKSFLRWSGAILPYDRDLYLIARTEHEASAARRQLSLIALDRVQGWFDDSAISSVGSQAIDSISGTALVGALRDDEVRVLDVRSASEAEEDGRIPGSINIPLPELEQRLAELPRDKPIAVHCAGGMRGAVAASLLRRDGIDDARILEGGYDAYREAAEGP